MQSFSDIIERFGCPQLAVALNKPYATVASWKFRDVLPSAFWNQVVKEARRRDLDDVTLETLASIEAKRKKRPAAFIHLVEEHAAP